MIAFILMETRMHLTKGGQITIHAPIRHRWGTSTVLLDDQGRRIVIEPAPDDPIAAAQGCTCVAVGSRVGPGGLGIIAPTGGLDPCIPG